ncbi:MAG: DUF2304 domain-containing protein [Candidatus Omnitrophica bacterium]|nr:DUF2304 domain-containing protein [Candidatus Omnitrophota bacterium]
MLIRQKIFAIFISIAIFAIIIELVRRRKLREEYSWLWIATGVWLFILSVWYDLLMAITRFIGAGLATSTLFFFGIVFLILINLHYSIVISTLTNQIKNLSQEIALLENKVEASKQ